MAVQPPYWEYSWAKREAQEVKNVSMAIDATRVFFLVECSIGERGLLWINWLVRSKRSMHENNEIINAKL